MLSIHSNQGASIAMTALNKNNGLLSQAMERLGTGYRINGASDDAAGLQIASRLTAQTRGMDVAQKNIGDATSLLSTADQSLSEVTNIAYRMKDLATQSANDTNSAADRAALDAEYQELKTEMGRIMTDTSYGGETLLEAGKLAAPASFQIGAATTEVLTFDASAEITNINTARTALVDVGTDAVTSQTEMTSLDTLLSEVGALRSKLGANMNRLEHTSNNLGAVSQGLEEATGRIMDADFAVESANMSKQQMLMQSGISVLGAAKQSTQLVASLLR